MTIYLYGLVLGRSAHMVPAHIAGIDATVLRVVACEDEGLGALVSTLARAPGRPTLDAVRAHDHALQSVVHHGSTAAAVRFGQTFASDDEIRRHVAERGGIVARALEAHDGCVEMRLLLAQGPEVHTRPATARAKKKGAEGLEEPGPGRAYLEQLKSSADAETVEGLGLRGALGTTVRGERVERLAPRGVVFSHLIRRGDEKVYREAIANLPALAEAVVVGPLALYNFTGPADE